MTHAFEWAPSRTWPYASNRAFSLRRRSAWRSLFFFCALRRVPGVEAQLMTPLVHGAGQRAKDGQDGEHGNGEFEHQPQVQLGDQADEQCDAREDDQYHAIAEPET